MRNARRSAPTRGLVGLTATALAVGLAVLAPAGPASAVPPTIAGDYASVTAATFRPVSDRDTCLDAVRIDVAVDFQGLSDEITGQGYAAQDQRPIYTDLQWDASYRITGPDNFYADGSTLRHYYPDAAGEDTFRFCPDDFGHDRIQAGTYTVSWTVMVHNGYATPICKAGECQRYPQLYKRESTFTFTLASTCAQATAAAKKAQAKVTRTTKAVAKSKSPRAKRKAKRQLRAAKRQLSTARAVKRSAC